MLSAAISVQAFIIFPYTFLAPNAVPEADMSLGDQPADVSIMVANIFL